MAGLLIRRACLGVLTVLAAASLAFLLAWNAPGGPAVGLAELTGPALIYGVTIHANTASVLAVRPRLLREIKETVDREGLAPPPPVQMVRQVV